MGFTTALKEEKCKSMLS